MSTSAARVGEVREPVGLPPLARGVCVGDIIVDYGLPLIPYDARILDIGCGPRKRWYPIGPSHRLHLVDPDPRNVADGLPTPGNIQRTLGSGESMPFVADRSVDLVVARVSLPYMRPQKTIPEMARVLVDGGTVLLTLHDAPSLWRHLWSNLGSPSRWGDIPTKLYALANGLWAMLGGNPFGYPLSRRGYVEWFQTERDIVRRLTDCGFTNIRSHQHALWPRSMYTTWIVTATKAQP